MNINIDSMNTKVTIKEIIPKIQLKLY